MIVVFLYLDIENMFDIIVIRGLMNNILIDNKINIEDMIYEIRRKLFAVEIFDYKYKQYVAK